MEWDERRGGRDGEEVQGEWVAGGRRSASRAREPRSDALDEKIGSYMGAAN